jgi:hypothetical protein
MPPRSVRAATRKVINPPLATGWACRIARAQWYTPASISQTVDAVDEVPVVQARNFPSGDQARLTPSER